MLRLKTRIASLTAVVLFALVAVSAHHSNSLLLADAQEPAKPEGMTSKLKELQKERLATIREFARLVTQRVRNNEGTLDELMEAAHLVHEAELELCESDKDQIAVLETYLAKAQENERKALRASKAGQGRESTALQAKSERLRAEIALERVKAKKKAPQQGAANSEPAANVKVVQPKKGDGLEFSTQPAIIQAYESVRVFAQVSGALQKQTVDIGDRVKRGQVLAVVDAADMEAHLKHDSAAVNQARARVQQAKARLHGVEADLETVALAVKQAEANVKSATAFVRYREKQWKRLKDLFDAKSIEGHLLDENKERLDAAVEAEHSARAAVATAKAQVVAAMTKIEQGRADLTATEAGFMVAQANLDKSQAQLSYATINAPFDGVITQRGYSPGDFIRSADKRSHDAPLFTVERTDLMRVIVSIPQRNVPFVNVGDAAELEIDALPGKKWSAKISRMAAALDPRTRSMSVEIDIPNPTGQIRSGMTARATILFEGQKK